MKGSSENNETHEEFITKKGKIDTDRLLLAIYDRLCDLTNYFAKLGTFKTGLNEIEQKTKDLAGQLTVLEENLDRIKKAIQSVDADVNRLTKKSGSEIGKLFEDYKSLYSCLENSGMNLLKRLDESIRHLEFALKDEFVQLSKERMTNLDHIVKLFSFLKLQESLKSAPASTDVLKSLSDDLKSSTAMLLNALEDFITGVNQLKTNKIIKDEPDETSRRDDVDGRQA
ncbi:MAG: hypothetical protein ACTSRA_13285 [Promethearchaeota archaeon]